MRVIPDTECPPKPVSLSEATGPVFGHDALGALDNDMIRNAAVDGDAVGERIVVLAQHVERLARLSARDQRTRDLQRVRRCPRTVPAERKRVESELRHARDAIRGDTSARNSRQSWSESSALRRILYTSPQCLWSRAPVSPCR